MTLLMTQDTRISKPPPLRRRVGRLPYNNTYTFTEYNHFSQEIPYSIHFKNFPYDELIPLHYGNTVEILYCEELKGMVTANRQNILLNGGNAVIFIHPFTVHSTNICKSPGLMYVLKISLNDLRNFIDLEKIYDFNGNHMDCLPVCYPRPEEFGCIIKEMIRQDHSIYARLRCLLNLFELFESHIMEKKKTFVKANAIEGDKLRWLINWTNEHFAEQITIQDVANKMSLNKYYFCKYFKTITGITYWTYLNQVRMAHAAKLVEQGKSTTECCYECGFESISYFIQLFKRTYGCSTLQYRSQYNKAIAEARQSSNNVYPPATSKQEHHAKTVWENDVKLLKKQ